MLAQLRLVAEIFLVSSKRDTICPERPPDINLPSYIGT
ncbi:hypothetical protein AVEN_111130-1, partial [Araneus ventricosus]